jgi:hypothetical protein
MRRPRAFRVQVFAAAAAVASLLGCARQALPPKPAPSRVSSTSAAATGPLSAEEARQAVVELIRRRPDLFIGHPDPDRLAKLPLVDVGEGKYQFGAITVHPQKGWYNADVGREGPEPYHYEGKIKREGDRWLASEPEVTRFHRRP